MDITQKELCAYLKYHREFVLDVTQIHIGNLIGYKHCNNVTMIETNRTNMPLSRIEDWVRAYELDWVYYAIFLKVFHEEIFILMMNIVKSINDDSSEKITHAINEEIKHIKSIPGV